jgi:hypothetical protein
MNKQLDWNYRQRIPSELLLSRNTEMGVVLYSSPELTAVDLVQFAGHVGGFQRAATVLSELVDTVDMSRMEPVFPYTSSATLQRLGYLLEVVLGEEEKANELYRLLKTAYPNTKKVLLSNSSPIKNDAESNRWHVNGNIDIETDEL